MKKEVLFTQQTLDFIESLSHDAEVKLRCAVAVLQEEGTLHAPVAEVRKALRIKRELGL